MSFADWRSKRDRQSRISLLDFQDVVDGLYMLSIKDCFFESAANLDYELKW